MAEFVDACTRGDLSEVKRLLDCDIDHNHMNDDCLTGFWHACENKHLDVVAELLKHDKVDVNTPVACNVATAFDYACFCGSVELVSLLLKHPRVNVQTITRYGMTPYHQAAAGDHLDVLRLLENDPRIDKIRTNDTGATPLATAASRGHVSVVSYLVSQTHGRINQVCKNLTALHEACYHGHVEVTKVLLQAPDIEVNIRSGRYEETPFFKACTRGHPEVVRLLLRDPRVDVNIHNVSGHTPFYASYKYLNILKLLIRDPRIDMNRQQQEGATIFFALVDWGLFEPIETAFAGVHRIDTKITYFNITPAMRAIQRGREDIAALINDYEVNPDKVRRVMQRKYGFLPEFAAELFAMVVFYCDSYLQLVASPPENARRFFLMISKLPMELQMTVCNRVFDLSGDLIPAKERDMAFSALLSQK